MFPGSHSQHCSQGNDCNMASMPSLPSLPLEIGKEDSMSHTAPVNLTAEASNGHLSQVIHDSRHIQDDPSQNSLVTPLATAFHLISSCVSSVPYIPTFTAQNCLSPEDKVALNGCNRIVAESEIDVEEDKKPDREHKKRSKNWSRAETLKLIRLRTDLAPRFDRTGRKSELWDQIAITLQQDQFSRDGQQCRDKWEKLMAGYKEVRDGLKEQEDNPFYEELHSLLSGRSLKRDKESSLFHNENENEAEIQHATSDCVTKDTDREFPPRLLVKGEGTEEEDDVLDEKMSSRKRQRGPKYVAVTDLHAVQTLLETVIARQQKFFVEFLDAMDQKEQIREQIRQEREEKWRAEERAQRSIFNNAMILLTQKLVGERVGATSGFSASLVCNPVSQQGPMKRSKNWKRGEVLQLINLRGEMEAKFSKSTRRAAVWEELAEALGLQGIKRDGKQCREKWDKLMSEYKDVIDGKREQSDSPYFIELTAVVGGRPGEAE